MKTGAKRLIDNPAWPFNPNFPKPFSFPDLGTVEWLALARWTPCKGDATKIPNAGTMRAGAKVNWQIIWRDICRYCPPKPQPVRISNITDYSMKNPEGWVQTLIDMDRFWSWEINAWAMEMVVKEYEATNPDVQMAVRNCANFSDWPDVAKLCEHFCRRFHAYQQARYRWHEHLLEKHCDRALGKRDKKPQTTLEARACLIGWLSRQRGYARHPLVTSFTRRKARPEKKQERYFFEKERCAPSTHRYRVTPDEIGWLILAFPIWNFCMWRWTDIGEAVIKKFRFGDRDFMPTSRKRFLNAIRKNSDKERMPFENLRALFNKYIANPTPKEKEMHKDWERDVHIQRRASAIKELAKLAIGDGLAKQIEPRPSGRGTKQKPPLWDFAQRISA